MLPFGLGQLVASAVQPHIVYFRRQGLYLGVTAAFVMLGVVFLMITLFLALTYLMAPIWAALFCAGVSLSLAGGFALVVFRRARLRRVGNVHVLETEEDTLGDEEIARGTLKTVATAAAPVAALGLIGIVLFMLGRQFGDDD